LAGGAVKDVWAMVLTTEREPEHEVVIEMSESKGKVLTLEQARARADTYLRYNIDTMETADR